MDETYEPGWFQARSSRYFSIPVSLGADCFCSTPAYEVCSIASCDLQRSVTRRWSYLLALHKAVEGRTTSKEGTTMDDSRFDALTKTLATPTSRRQALKAFAATALAGMLSLSSLDKVFAKPKCHHAGLGCDTDSKCCSNLCCTGICCASGQICQNGQCIQACQTLCNGTSARACSNTGSLCAGTSCGCLPALSSPTGGYCSSGGEDGACKSDCDCPAGFFCLAAGVCFSAQGCPC